MTRSRRKFLQNTATGLLVTANMDDSVAQDTTPPAGAPPAFNTSTPVGPAVSPSTFAEAEKLVQVRLSEPQRTIAAASWRTSMAPLYERRTGPHPVALEPTLAPASQWNPELPDFALGPRQNRFVRSQLPERLLPVDEGSIASAVDYVQADRLRRKVAQEMGRVFSQVDLLLVPSLREEMLTITNFTGHPSLTLRAGFVTVPEARSDWAPDPAHPLPKFSPPRRVPHGITLIGRLFDEGTLGRVGMALERQFAVSSERPPGF